MLSRSVILGALGSLATYALDYSNKALALLSGILTVYLLIIKIRKEKSTVKKGHKVNWFRGMLSLLLLTGVVILPGCGTAGGLFTRPVTGVVPSTKVEIVTVTNWVTQIVTSNTASGESLPVATNRIAASVVTTTNYVPCLVTNYGAWEVSQGASSVIQTGQAIAPLVPGPVGPIAELGLGLLSAVLLLVLKVKNSRLTETRTGLEQATSALSAVIAGVEAAGNAQTKQAVQSHATAAGVQTFLDPLVQSVSKEMPNTPKQ